MSTVNTIGQSGYKTVVTVPWAAGNEWLLAGNAGPKVGSPQTAYAVIPLLYRAVKLRVDSLSRIKTHVYKDGEEVDAWPFEGTMKLKEFIRKTELALLLRGGSFSVKLKNEFGMRLGLQWLNPFFVVVWLDGQTYMFSYSVAGQTVPLQNRQWSQDDMVYWREFNPVNDIQPGVAPAQVALTDSQVSFNISQFLAQFFETGAMPATLVVVPEGTGDKEKAELEGWFARKISGLRNAWKAIALKGEVKIEKLTPELKTFEIKALDDHCMEAVCNAFDIPQSILRTGSSNRATAETEYTNYLQHTVIPRASWFEEQINDLLDEEAPGFRVEFAPNDLPEMQGDEAKRSEAFKNYVDAGMPIDVAADITGLQLTDEMRSRLGAIGPRNPMEIIEPEVKAELERYERKAIKSVAERKTAQVEFKSNLIPRATMDRLGFMLSDAKTAGDVKSVFKAVTSHVPEDSATKSVGDIHLHVNTPEGKTIVQTIPAPHVDVHNAAAEIKVGDVTVNLAERQVDVHVPKQELSIKNEIHVPEQKPGEVHIDNHVKVEVPKQDPIEVKGGNVIVHVPQQPAPVVEVSIDNAPVNAKITRDAQGRATGIVSK